MRTLKSVPVAAAATLMALVALTGCGASSPQQPPPTADYLTVGKGPRRDADAARQLDEKAIVLMDHGDNTAAEQTLKQALASDVTFGPAHNNLGLVYYRQGQLYLAAWEFQYATKLMPGVPEPKNNLGLVFEAGSKLDQAVESYQAAMNLEPDNPQYVGNLIRVRLRRGDHGTEVRELLAKVVSIDTRPQWVAWAKERLALMRLQQDQPQSP